MHNTRNFLGLDIHARVDMLSQGNAKSQLTSFFFW